jgi:hypothetical protein
MQALHILAQVPPNWLKELTDAEHRPAKPLERRTYVRGTLVKLKRAGNRK